MINDVKKVTVKYNGNPTKDDLLAVAKEFRLSVSKCKAIMDSVERICK